MEYLTFLEMRIHVRRVQSVPGQGGKMHKDVPELLAPEPHGTPMRYPCALIKHHLPRLKVHLLAPRLVGVDHLQRPAAVPVRPLRHLEHGARHVRLLAVQVVHQHGAAAVDAYAEGLGVPQPHLRPPLEHLLHLPRDCALHVAEAVQADDVHGDLRVVGEAAGDGLVAPEGVGQALLVPGVEDLLQAVCHLHLQVAALVRGDVDQVARLPAVEVVNGLADFVRGPGELV
mmetsp:Transcript_53857/g.129762  ORF Transcript_53857/g.129762 Transcript_53857/m.129762 type:complete len:229 (-) Transcript_53857:615-1301(-)